MRYQDQIVRSTQKALDDICRAAIAVPADKVEWVPMGEARTVLSQMQEIAVSALWFLPIIRDGVKPDFSGHAAREAMRLKESCLSVDQCIAAAKASTTELCLAISSFPETRLEEEISLPFGTMTYAEVLGMHAWNMVYHLGQINVFQLMLGDKVMH